VAPIEPRMSEDALSSACLVRRCSSSWDLVEPRHRWPLASRKQTGIGHVNGVGAGVGVSMAPMALVGGGVRGGTPVSTGTCAWGGWAGGHLMRGRAVVVVMVGPRVSVDAARSCVNGNGQHWLPQLACSTFFLQAQRPHQYHVSAC
jgi:hypothetical protein